MVTLRLFLSGQDQKALLGVGAQDTARTCPQDPRK